MGAFSLLRAKGSMRPFGFMAIDKEDCGRKSEGLGEKSRQVEDTSACVQHCCRRDGLFSFSIFPGPQSLNTGSSRCDRVPGPRPFKTLIPAFDVLDVWSR